MAKRTGLASLKPRVGIANLRTVEPPHRQADAYYASSERRAWRAAVIRRAGGRCERPGCGRAKPIFNTYGSAAPPNPLILLILTEQDAKM